jgi:hypothetical protein
MDNKIIVLRSVYGKVKECHLQPCKQANGTNFPFVKPVRYDSNGNMEMIMSDKERASKESQYFIPEDEMITITDGTTFDLSNPREENRWLAIKDSFLIAPSRDARDGKGISLIDGDKTRYGLAEFYIDIPGEESAKSVSKKKLITKAWQYIEEDSADGRLTKCKLLGRNLRNAPSSDVEEFLYNKAGENPQRIIELYTSADVALQLLLIDAREKGTIKKVNGMWMYGEDTVLGATDESIMLWFKIPENKSVLELIRNETYPEYMVIKKGK